jgi:hypothetical protein
VKLKQLIPLRARVYLRERQWEWERSRALRRGIRALKAQPRGSDRVWRDLVHGWEHGWAAGPDYLDAVAASAVAVRGPILECGSGLTTVVLAAIARRTGSPIWALEHDPSWFEVAEKALRRFGLDANLTLAPLEDYGEFDWYRVAPSELPLFSLVVCDGPPGWARGGRYGLLPVLRERLAPGCAILLDDAARPSERQVLRRWASEASLAYEIRGEERALAVVRLSQEHTTRASRLSPGRALRGE